MFSITTHLRPSSNLELDFTMIDESKQYHPTETKLCNGILYSVLVPINEARVSVLIGEGMEPIEEEIECPDLSPENHLELFERGHSLARKIIQSEDSRLKPIVKLMKEKRVNE